MKRRHLSVAVSLALSALFLGLAARNVASGELWEALAGARWRWIPLMASVSLLDLVIRAARWRLLLSKSKDAPAPLLFRLEAIGLAVNNVLFLRLGELARAFLAGRELGLPVATTLSSVAVERALDVAALLAIFCAASPFAPGLVPAPLLRTGLTVLAVAAAVLVLLAVAEGPLLPGGAWERRLRRWPRAHDLLSQLAVGAAALREWRAAAAISALSLALWLADAGFYWAGARAMGLGWAVDYPRAVLILSWAGAGAALPAAPGAIGTFEAMVTSMAVKLGAPQSRAFGFAVFSHMVGYAVVTGLGLVFLYRVGLSLAGLKGALGKSR